MKLPNYLKCLEVKDLLIKMGVQNIPELSHVTFVRKVTKTTTIEIENPKLTFNKKIYLESVPVSQTNVSIGKDGTIEVNGIKACAYIKKQRQGIDMYNKTSTYRYHLCNCKTIEQMINGGRKDRYVSTTRDDGLFEVIDQIGGSARKLELRLELCHNCKKILEHKRMLPNPYSLKSFFNKYQPEIPKTIKRTESVLVEEQYAPNHNEIAVLFKEQVGYKCQLCGVNCSTTKQCIHLHHKDGNGQNNLAHNLNVLCTDCHSKQYNHSQMLANLNFKRQIDTIIGLRSEQKIHTVG